MTRRSARLVSLLCVALPLACSGPAEEQRESSPSGEGAPCVGALCRLEQLSRETEQAGGPQRSRWEELPAPSFRVFHFDAERAAEVARAAEEERARQLSLWGLDSTQVWRPRCEVYLYPSELAFKQMTGRDYAVARASAQGSQLYRGRVVHRRMFLIADERELLSGTLAHELAHVVTADLVGGKRAPLWANEGLSVDAEQSGVRRRYQEVMRAALELRRAIPLSALLTMRRYPEAREQVYVFYAESWSVTSFLLKQGGRATFLRFLQELAAGANPGAALIRHYSVSVEELERRWRTQASRRQR